MIVTMFFIFNQCYFNSTNQPTKNFKISTNFNLSTTISSSTIIIDVNFTIFACSAITISSYIVSTTITLTCNFTFTSTNNFTVCLVLLLKILLRNLLYKFSSSISNCSRGSCYWS